MQVFDGNGKYETQWNNLHRPCALHCCGGKQPNFIIGELGPGMPVNRKVPNLGPRLTIVDAKGKRIARLGGENGPGLETGKFLAPHGIALDSKGDIYVGEVGVTDWKTSFPDTPMPPEVGVVALPAEAWRRSSLILASLREAKRRSNPSASRWLDGLLRWRSAMTDAGSSPPGMAGSSTYSVLIFDALMIGHQRSALGLLERAQRFRRLLRRSA